MLKLLPFFLAFNAAPDLEQDLLAQPSVEKWSVPVQVLREAKELRIYAYDLGDCTLYKQESVVRASDVILDGVIPHGAKAPAIVRADLEALVPNEFEDVGSSMCFEPHHFLRGLTQMANQSPRRKCVSSAKSSSSLTRTRRYKSH